MSERTLIWQDRVQNLRAAFGREPTTSELLDAAQIHDMTPDEIEVQAESYALGMSACEHGVLDFEECPECRKGRSR